LIVGICVAIWEEVLEVEPPILEAFVAEAGV
jgi:hypothetical protein